MKRLIIFCALFTLACTSKTQEWDSGAARQDAYQQERMEERAKDVGNQNPQPGTVTQPF